MNKKISPYIDKVVKDKDGKTVLFQAPNIPIVGWFMFTVIAYFLPTGMIKTGFMSLGGAFLFIWAYLEITDGANYFRRLLGLIVMAVVISNFFVL